MSSHRYPTKPAASDREDSPLNVVQPNYRKGEGSARKNTQHPQEAPKLHVRKDDLSSHPPKTHKYSPHMSPEPYQRPGEDNRSFQPDLPPLRPDSSQYLQDKSGYMAMRSVLDVTNKDTSGTNTCERDEDKEMKPVNVNEKIQQFDELVGWRKWSINNKHNMNAQKTNSQERLSDTLQFFEDITCFSHSRPSLCPLSLTVSYLTQFSLFYNHLLLFRIECSFLSGDFEKR
ncbi:uncharacterized protein LOC134571388 [Pelobates fuscus]|uniref:uncharacterized protein LOC134571388 n=1 Tax=Pelobates fuscus TaxID=191477 RepID=UPI002FE47270